MGKINAIMCCYFAALGWLRLSLHSVTPLLHAATCDVHRQTKILDIVSESIKDTLADMHRYGMRDPAHSQPRANSNSQRLRIKKPRPVQLCMSFFARPLFVQFVNVHTHPP
jgi:hypothetical protein